MQRKRGGATTTGKLCRCCTWLIGTAVSCGCLSCTSSSLSLGRACCEGPATIGDGCSGGVCACDAGVAALMLLGRCCGREAGRGLSGKSCCFRGKGEEEGRERTERRRRCLDRLLLLRGSSWARGLADKEAMNHNNDAMRKHLHNQSLEVRNSETQNAGYKIENPNLDDQECRSAAGTMQGINIWASRIAAQQVWTFHQASSTLLGGVSSRNKGDR
eukprot:scaffold18462_cov16-Tisochrysis_lutea.AAC.1